MELDHDSLIDLYMLDQGIYMAFNRIYTGSAEKSDSSLYDLTINFSIKGRCDVTLKSGKYAIVKENHLSISTSAPDKDFYFPGNLYEGIQLYIDCSVQQIRNGEDFFSMLGVSPFSFKHLFCENNGGLYIASLSDDMMPDIRSIWEMRDDPDLPMIRYLLVSLFHKILKLPEKSENEAFFTRSQIAIVKEAEKIILSDLSKKHSAKEMAEYFGVSESSFKLYVKGILGESYLPYFRRKRMEKAAELLESTNLKVIEIASNVGYDNQGKFAKVFADFYGVSPLEYRRLSK